MSSEDDAIREFVRRTSEDDAILETARRTSDILGLKGFYPTVVSWTSVEKPKRGMTGGRYEKVITPHFPVLAHTVLKISPILQGRLASEDWGPILAPSLIFYRTLKKSYNIASLVRVLPGLLLFAGFYVLSYLYAPHPDALVVLGFIVLMPVLVILAAYTIWFRLGRRFVLEADREAAKIIGTTALTDVLQKLESMREVDASRGNDWPENGDHPSITKRIANLQNP